MAVSPSATHGAQRRSPQEQAEPSQTLSAFSLSPLLSVQNAPKSLRDVSRDVQTLPSPEIEPSLSGNLTAAGSQSSHVDAVGSVSKDPNVVINVLTPEMGSGDLDTPVTDSALPDDFDTSPPETRRLEPPPQTALTEMRRPACCRPHLQLWPRDGPNSSAAFAAFHNIINRYFDLLNPYCR